MDKRGNGAGSRAGEPMAAGTAQAEMEDRAAGERKAREAREAWLAGPTEEEKEEWARRERMRRLAMAGMRPDYTEEEMDRLVRRYRREAQLAMEGALYWALRWPFELMAALVRAGRQWEEEYFRATPRRRVRLYDEE